MKVRYQPVRRGDKITLSCEHLPNAHVVLRPHFFYLLDYVTRTEYFQIGDRKNFFTAIVFFRYVDKQ